MKKQLRHINKSKHNNRFYFFSITKLVSYLYFKVPQCIFNHVLKEGIDTSTYVDEFIMALSFRLSTKMKTPKCALPYRQLANYTEQIMSPFFIQTHLLLLYIIRRIFIAARPCKYL